MVIEKNMRRSVAWITIKLSLRQRSLVCIRNIQLIDYCFKIEWCTAVVQYVNKRLANGESPYLIDCLCSSNKLIAIRVTDIHVVYFSRSPLNSGKRFEMTIFSWQLLYLNFTVFIKQTLTFRIILLGNCSKCHSQKLRKFVLFGSDCLYFFK